MAPIVITGVEFSEPPPDIEELRARLEERCGHKITSRRRELTEGEIRYAQAQGHALSERPSDGELWLAELPELKIEVRASELRESPPRADFFQELGWTVPSPALPYWRVSVRGDLTLQAALADVLRDCRGRVWDDNPPRISGPIDIADLRQQLAKARHWSWIGILSIPLVIIYLLFLVALTPIWLSVTALAFTRSRKRRWLRRTLWMTSGKVDVFEAAAALHFGQHLVRRIGRSNGKIGVASRLFGSRPRCRMPAKIWSSRQEVGPWTSAAAIVRGLCHTDRGSPWHIQFADEPPEPLADWLDREMRMPYQSVLG